MRGGLTDWGLVLAVEEESQLNRLDAFIRKLCKEKRIRN